MQELGGYYRYPTIHQDTVVFVSEDDLWTVPRQGGPARRLTVQVAEASRPRLSPDGQLLAFVGKEAGDQEVYCMPSAGGPAKRLTFQGANVSVQGWDPQGRIVFASNSAGPFRAWYQLWTVSPKGGEPEVLQYGRANGISFGGNGGVVLGRNTQDPARWKRYRGGTRGALWIAPDKDQPFYRYEGLNGNFASPMWVDSRVYFLCDADGVGNLYSILPNGDDLIRHTHHEDYYVRNASSDGQRIVYHRGANLYYFDPGTQQETPIAIDYPSPFAQRERLYPGFARYWTGYQFDPGDSESLLLTSRGRLFQMQAFEGPVLPVGVTQGVRYRLAQWLPGGDRILAVSDEGGEEALTKICPGGIEPQERLPQDLGQATAIEISPDGKYAALANTRMELWLVDLDQWHADRVDLSSSGSMLGLDFSPDSRWLAYGFPDGQRQSTIKLYDIESKEAHALTGTAMTDVQPAFDPDGKYLYFLSYRVFNPVYDNLRFDLGFPKGMRPYVIMLANDTLSPFLHPSSVRTKPKSPAEPAPEPAEDDHADSDSESSSHVKPVVIDLEGIEHRILALPVAEGRYTQIAATAGRLLYTVLEPEGSLDQSFYPGPPRAKATLKMYDLKTQKEEVLAPHISGFTLSSDRSMAMIRSRQVLRLIKAGERVDEKKRELGRESGLVDLSRIVVEVDRMAEWGQMLREAWRLMRENFWTEDMSGVDWEQIYYRYQALLPRVATRGEFSDLMWEMQGELGTSHAYEMGGDYRPEPAHRLGHLAAKGSFDLEQDGFRLTAIAEGDSWQDGHDSPLNTPGVSLQVGDVIRAVDRRPVGPDLPPQALLLNKAGKPVMLTVLRQGRETPEEVVVRPLASALEVYYRQWVNQNRRYVHDKSQGQLGYVHIPDMGPRGYAEFFRGYLDEDHRPGLIVDVRFNGGGHVSQLILEHLARRRLGYDLPRYGKPIPYPEDSILGPIVALTNEHAGSDGDIFSHAFQMLKLGPLVGTRTWGGVVGINPKISLVDGSVVTQPEYAYWFQDVGFAVENYGTDPDIVVDVTPNDALEHTDPQLDRALMEALKLLAETKPAVPDFGPRPHQNISPRQ